MSDDIVLDLINDVPVIGARFRHRDRAVAEAKRLAGRVALYLQPGGEADVQVSFAPGEGGTYALRLSSGDELITAIDGLDEVTLWRFKKAYGAKKMFILTCFVDSPEKEARPLVVTDGLGVVIYKPAGGR